MKSVLQERIESQTPEDVIKSLCESNELLKTMDSIKGVMFKIQKDLKPFLDKAQSLGLIKSYKSTIKPYNSGYELRNELDHDYKVNPKDIGMEDVANILFNLSSIYCYGSSYFQEDLDRGDEPYIEGYLIQTAKGDQKYYREVIRSKKDVKPVTDAYYKLNKKSIDKLNKMIK